MLLTFSLVAFPLSLCVHLFKQRRTLTVPNISRTSAVSKKTFWKCPTVSVSHCSFPNPAGALPKVSRCSPTGRWLCGGTRGPPAGRSTPATAKATATRPTECQTESGEREEGGGGGRGRRRRVTLNFDVIHNRLQTQRQSERANSEQHGKVNSGRQL